ncbi:MAG: metallophosphoesterase [Vagococcus sp.]
MGRLGIMSDLHVDINQFTPKELLVLTTVLKQQQVTHLHLAGDTANQVTRVLETVDFIEQQGIAITFNFGNHELPSIASPKEMEAYPDHRFLNLTTHPLNTNLVLLGLNGWYDYSFSLETNQQAILASKQRFWYDRLIERHMSDPEVMTHILENLTTVLDALYQEGKEVILATHFVPQEQFIHYHTGKYERFNQINAFLGSQALGELINTSPHVKQVVFGHTHRQFESTVIHGTEYTAKPFGYFYEWQLTQTFMKSTNLMTQFNPMKVRKLLKMHQPEFNQFKEQHLAQEFTKKITLIDY